MPVWRMTPGATIVINDADAGDIVGGLSRLDVRLAAIPLDTQPILTDRREMHAARNKGHVRPAPGARGATTPALFPGAARRGPPGETKVPPPPAGASEAP